MLVITTLVYWHGTLWNPPTPMWKDGMVSCCSWGAWVGSNSTARPSHVRGYVRVKCVTLFILGSMLRNTSQDAPKGLRCVKLVMSSLLAALRLYRSLFCLTLLLHSAAASSHVELSCSMLGSRLSTEMLRPLVWGRRARMCPSMVCLRLASWGLGRLAFISKATFGASCKTLC